LLGVVLLAKRRQAIPSARALLQRLENEAGMYLSEDTRNATLLAVGEWWRRRERGEPSARDSCAGQTSAAVDSVMLGLTDRNSPTVSTDEPFL